MAKCLRMVYRLETGFFCEQLGFPSSKPSCQVQLASVQYLPHVFQQPCKSSLSLAEACPPLPLTSHSVVASKYNLDMSSIVKGSEARSVTYKHDHVMTMRAAKGSRKSVIIRCCVFFLIINFLLIDFLALPLFLSMST